MTFLLPLPSCFVLSPYKLSWYGIRHLYYVCLFWLIYWITLAFEADSLLFQLVERLQKTSTRNLRLLATSACSPRRSARHVCLLATRTCSPLRSARQVRLLTTCHIQHVAYVVFCYGIRPNRVLILLCWTVANFDFRLYHTLFFKFYEVLSDKQTDELN